METNWVLYVKLVLFAIGVAAWIVVFLCVSKLAIETAWTWLMSKVSACSETTCPTCGQSAFGATESSSTPGENQD